MNPTPLDIIDEPAYLRFCTRTRSLYSTLSPTDAITRATEDLLRFGNDAYARGDHDTVGRLHYCLSRLSQDWDAYVARTKAQRPLQGPHSHGQDQGHTSPQEVSR